MNPFDTMPTRLADASIKITCEDLASKVLILMVGLPGSGKSTFATKKFPDFPCFETDKFFMKNDEYVFEPYKLGYFHMKNLEGATWWMKNKGTPLVVANTNLSRKERKPYLKAAEEHGYETWIFVMKTQFQNQHNVPEEALERMKRKFVFPSMDENPSITRIIEVK